MNIESLAASLRDSAGTDKELEWPTSGLRVLREAGCFKHIVPRKLGGEGAASADQLAVYETIARERVALALILTQHDAAVEVLSDATSDSIASEILTACVDGDELLTVGISQVTTSRRHGRAAMRAEHSSEGFILDGIMPWVTSAPQANHIVTAAVFEDGQQILVCVPTRTKGIEIREPMELLALQASWTSEVRCQSLQVPPPWVLRGPMESVLSRRAPVKGLTVSSVGMGMAGALLREVRQLADKLPGAEILLAETIEPRYQAVRQGLLGAAGSLHDPAAESPAIAIRADVNGVINQLSATLMTLAKGTGFLLTADTQRLLREAAFFLVWSAAPPVQIETLNRIWDVTSHDN